jgi:uncharacterized protein (TIGR02246 family)
VTENLTGVLTALETAWNDLDAPAVGAAFAADAIYVTRAGIAWQGRSAIERGFAKSFEGPFGDLRLRLTPRAIRFLSATVSVVLADVEFSNETASVRGTTTFVLTVDAHGWVIASAHTSETPSVH